jgi:signal transduction histidine kinase
LLGFARKQTIAPKVIDVNDNVARIIKMLGTLIGEDIDLVWLPGADLKPVMMDPTQLDQIMANLCVNARDAISGVGKITILSWFVVPVRAWPLLKNRFPLHPWQARCMTCW